MSGFAGNQKFARICVSLSAYEVFHCSRTRNKQGWLLLLLNPDRVWSCLCVLSVAALSKVLQLSQACVPWAGVANPGLLSCCTLQVAQV